MILPRLEKRHTIRNLQSYNSKNKATTNNTTPAIQTRKRNPGLLNLYMSFIYLISEQCYELML